MAKRRKCLQEYAINTGVTEGSVLDPALFVLYNDDVRNDVICKIAIWIC